jgi:cyclopropane-fatty-acyl-phospholipid synthase
MWQDRLAQSAISRLRARRAPVHVKFWNGAEYAPDGQPLIRVAVRSPTALRALAAPTLGALARAYVDQDIDIDGDMRDVLRAGERMCDVHDVTAPRQRLPWGLLRHGRRNDGRNIRFHYDVSNEFFALWLDPRLVYSCAYFGRGDDSLERAQEQKLELVCRKLLLRPELRLLDIGCGWGALLFWAAERHGVRCLGITLSKQQCDYVAAQIERRGLRGQVQVRLADYRDLPEDEPFDRIATVGMLEHVGQRNLQAFFSCQERLLAPGGLALNHGITSTRLDTSELGNDIGEFIDRYVFPGGELVHVVRLIEALSAAGLECVDAESLRPHYARTLWHWVDRLERNAEAACALVGEGRYRVWRVYMAGSAHAFTRGWISLFQLLAGKPLADGTLPYPYRRDHIYR